MNATERCIGCNGDPRACAISPCAWRREREARYLLRLHAAEAIGDALRILAGY